MITQRLDRFAVETKLLRDKQVNSRQLSSYFDMAASRGPDRPAPAPIAMESFSVSTPTSPIPPIRCLVSAARCGPHTTPSANGPITQKTYRGSLPATRRERRLDCHLVRRFPTSSNRTPGPRRWKWPPATDRPHPSVPYAPFQLSRSALEPFTTTSSRKEVHMPLIIIIVILFILLALAHPVIPAIRKGEMFMSTFRKFASGHHGPDHVVMIAVMLAGSVLSALRAPHADPEFFHAGPTLESVRALSSLVTTKNHPGRCHCQPDQRVHRGRCRRCSLSAATP